MIIENAKYIKDELIDTMSGIIATIDGEVVGVPISLDNRHYAEILRQVDAGELTIADAD
tara:strand:- start:27 stop:203 length:177 start_codon:yes stop_codon:yes gene_type:complete